MLASFLSRPPSPKFTVIYITSPGSAEGVEEPVAYEMDTPMSPMAHIELKRSLGLEERNGTSNITLPSGPLFEKYQYFTPGKLSIATTSVDHKLMRNRDFHGSPNDDLPPLHRICRHHWFGEP